MRLLTEYNQHMISHYYSTLIFTYADMVDTHCIWTPESGTIAFLKEKIYSINTTITLFGKFTSYHLRSNIDRLPCIFSGSFVHKFVKGSFLDIEFFLFRLCPNQASKMI